MHAQRLLAAAAVLVIAAACAPQPTPSIALPTAGSTPVPTALATVIPSGTAVAPSPGFFAFDAESILGYYASIGYTCAPAVPSTLAADHMYRSCQLVDPDGRTRVVGITTDAADEMADAFTSLTGKDTEAVLEPSLALEPFSAFLGAVLGETQGVALLEWLAGHIGDDSATTSLGDLTIATYSESPQDHSRLYVEIANQAYLESPSPSGSPGP